MIAQSIDCGIGFGPSTAAGPWTEKASIAATSAETALLNILLPFCGPDLDRGSKLRASSKARDSRHFAAVRAIHCPIADADMSAIGQPAAPRPLEC